MGKHCLATWIEKHTSQTVFAGKVECSESHLSLVLRGQRKLSYALAKRMSAAANGDLSAEEIQEDTERASLHESRKRKRAA